MAKSVQYQLGYRTFHSTEILEGDLYLLGGDQEGLPSVHDNEKKRSITTKVDVFNLSTIEWTKTATTGTPPAGVMDYGTAVIGQDMFVFGGRCDGGKCSHNELYAINTYSKVWRKIPCTDGPVEKSGCGFISYSYQGTDYLLALGGIAGKQPTQQQQHSLCIPDGYGGYYTNEIHTMEMTSSQGKWNVPIIKGERPPPLAWFTLDVLPNDRSKAILFGGFIVPEKDKSHPCADLYLLTLSSDTVEFIRLSRQSVSSSQWPEPRYWHSCTVIKSYIDSKEQSHLLVMGGLGTDLRTIADCWIMNLSLNKWNKIDLPESVCGRWVHSLSSVTMKRNTEWLIITGGGGMDYSPISGVNVTVIVEIEYVSSQWVVRGVWKSRQKEELTERMKKLRPERTGRNEEEMAHLQQEIQRLTKQLRDSQQETRKVRSDSHQLIQQAQQDTRQAQQETRQVRREFTEQVEQLTNRTDDLGKQIQQKDNNLQTMEEQVRSLQNNLAAKDRIIQRNDVTIADQQQEMRRYHDNPPWLIEREEVVMTEEVLGSGGWGEVKVGIFRGTRVAVKCLHQLIISEYYLQLFSREMDIASRVRHPNLLQFIGATRVGNPIIVTELMPTSLRKELEKCPMTKPQVVSIGIDITLALNYLHLWKPQPILHRDVSSANVLLEPSVQCKWKAKLSDYGSANLQENVHTAGPGSPVYSAPEATTPKLHSPAMDIYSVGILLVEMATGQFPSSVSFEREVQIQEVKWPLMKKLVLCCTHDDPKSRPTTEKLLEDLKAT